jgi:putative addiction module component (TIGR02574 family)
MTLLTQLQERALELSAVDRRRLAEVIWQSLEEEAFPLSEAQQQVLARRCEEYHANPGSFLTWDELQARLDELP